MAQYGPHAHLYKVTDSLKPRKSRPLRGDCTGIGGPNSTLTTTAVPGSKSTSSTGNPGWYRGKGIEMETVFNVKPSRSPKSVIKEGHFTINFSYCY
eukprot:1607532-Rhodomonas_salina.2